MERCLLERISGSFQNLVLGRDSVHPCAGTRRPGQVDIFVARRASGAGLIRCGLARGAGRDRKGRLVHFTSFLMIAGCLFA